MMPKVSICIPTYKQLDCAQRVSNSILAQDYTDYEVIITDDTPDDSLKLYFDSIKDQRFKYIKNIKPLGSPENWNESLRRAQGAYIKILHHDDWFSKPCSLSKFVAMMDANPACFLGFSACTSVDSQTQVRTRYSPTPDQLRQLDQRPHVLFGDNFIGAPSTIIFRNDYRYYFDSKVKYVVDIDFYISILIDHPKYCYHDEELIDINSGSVHQVTSSCVDNKAVELYEWIYLYNKLNLGNQISNNQARFIKHLLKKYRIRSVRHLREEIGLTAALPFSSRMQMLKNRLLAMATVS